MFRRSRPAPALLVILAALLLAAPVAAQSGPSAQRAGAEEILEQAQRIEDGLGIRSGRELTTVLAQLAANRNDLSRADRKEADRLLTRPTDANDGGVGGPYDASARVMSTCSTHFCVHWVDSTDDAPPLADSNSCSAPDYVEKVSTALEQSYAVENGQLDWRSPVSDGTHGGDGRTDVYLKQLNVGGTGLYGYAAADPGQSGRTRSAYLVLDDDYAEAEFPSYHGDPTTPIQVTSAHEYNHVLQYAYDIAQDPWMYEATATWAEEKVFPDDDDYLLYMGTWADNPATPITSPTGLKMYGSAIWNHWLEQRYGAVTVRRAWEDSVASGGFAPGAYGQAIQTAGGTSFAADFGDFAAATAEWDGTDSGIHEGIEFPRDVKRVSGPLTVGTIDRTATIDHTAYKLFNIPVAGIGTNPLRLTGSLRQGIDDGAVGTIALVGIKSSGDVTKVVARTNATGDAVVTLANPNTFTRLTAVVANADIRNSGFDALNDDWLWSRDGQAAKLSLASVSGATPSAPVEETGAPDVTAPPAGAVCGTTTVEHDPGAEPTPTPTATASATATPSPTPTVTPSVTPTPTVQPPLATSVRLSRSSTRIKSVLRKGVLALFAQSNKAGRLSARASLDTKTAKRLKVGRRTTTAGSGRRTTTAPARMRINVKLSRKVRAAIKRNRRRAVKVRVTVTFTPADGTRAVRRTITITLRP